MGTSASDQEIAELDQEDELENTTESFYDKIWELWAEAKRIFLGNGEPADSNGTEEKIIEVPSSVRDDREIEFIDEIEAELRECGHSDILLREELFTDEKLIGVADLYIEDEEKVIICGSSETLLAKTGISFSFKQEGYDVAVAIYDPDEVGRMEMKILDEADVDLIIPGENAPEVVTDYSSFRTEYSKDDFETESLLFWE